MYERIQDDQEVVWNKPGNTSFFIKIVIASTTIIEVAALSI